MVICFCCILGYKGFQDFKMDLVIEFVIIEFDDSSFLLDVEVSEFDDVYVIGLKLQNIISNVLFEMLNLFDM